MQFVRTKVSNCKAKFVTINVTNFHNSLPIDNAIHKTFISSFDAAIGYAIRKSFRYSYRCTDSHKHDTGRERGRCHQHRGSHHHCLINCGSGCVGGGVDHYRQWKRNGCRGGRWCSCGDRRWCRCGDGDGHILHSSGSRSRLDAGSDLAIYGHDQ